MLSCFVLRMRSEKLSQIHLSINFSSGGPASASTTLWRRWRRGLLREAEAWRCDAADVSKSRVSEVVGVMAGASDVGHLGKADSHDRHGNPDPAKRDVDGLRLRERLQVRKSQSVAEELDSLDLDLLSWSKASSSNDLVTGATESRCQPQEALPSGRSKELLFQVKR